LGGRYSNDEEEIKKEKKGSVIVRTEDGRTGLE